MFVLYYYFFTVAMLAQGLEFATCVFVRLVIQTTAKFIVELMHRDSIATSEPWSLFWLWFTQTMMIAMGWVLVPFNF